jgi:hypothetical protein
LELVSRINIDVLEYTIYAELDRQAPHNPPEGLLNLSTIPKITVVNQAEDHVLVLTGTGFTSNLYVFFGMIPAKNKRLRNNTMRVELLENLTVSLEPLPTTCEKVPILFIREDRIMFRSEFYLYVSV